MHRSATGAYLWMAHLKAACPTREQPTSTQTLSLLTPNLRSVVLLFTAASDISLACLLQADLLTCLWVLTRGHPLCNQTCTILAFCRCMDDVGLDKAIFIVVGPTLCALEV